MSLLSKNQLKLYGLEDYLNELINLYDDKKLPNKILLSGQKGIGKCTLAYHLINYILSKDEEFPYDLNSSSINRENRSYKLIQNGSNMNFALIDILTDKKNIDISQIRDLILILNKSSFNTKSRIVLIDNIEFLNINSVNALLKILEEPNDNIYFILINNNKEVLETIKSRCLNFKVSLSHETSLKISNKLVEKNIFDIINKDLINYYFTPGQIYNLVEFSNKHKIELLKFNLNEFILFLIENSFYKKDQFIRLFLYELIEFYFVTKISLNDISFCNRFLKKINNVKKFNLDDETLFLEFKSKVLNG
jgi:DNA polymerase-3 subunit delta'